jgi:hypothetical protein
MQRVSGHRVCVGHNVARSLLSQYRSLSLSSSMQTSACLCVYCVCVSMFVLPCRSVAGARETHQLAEGMRGMALGQQGQGQGQGEAVFITFSSGTG